MFERTPGNIEVVFPMKEGVISRFTDMQYLLQNLLKKERRFTRGSEYLIAVPTDVTEVEKRAFFDLVVHSTAKAKEVSIVMSSGELAKELMYYGVSAISLVTTGSHQQGLRACTSFIQDHQYAQLDERMAVFAENHPIA